MRKHVDLVGLLFVLWGGMSLLLSVSLVSIGIAATAIGAAAAPAASGGKVTAGIVAAVFFVLAAAGLVFGAVHVWIGTRLRRFREWARAFAIVLAAVDLVLIPFGTALAIYTFWALLNAQSKPLFEDRHG
jgi:sterol desaturase/sphingolipid hydroxylase (fatty acid hydroxylase superfamily)